MKNFCLFIGYPRSGSTVLSRILDMHPNIGIAHEHNVFRDKDIGYLFTSLLNKMYYTKSLDGLDVIGSKSDYKTLKFFIDNPSYKLSYFKNMIDMPLKILHIINDPYDNISTWSNAERNRKGFNQSDDLKDKIKIYKQLNKEIEKLIKKEDVLSIRMDDLIEHPGATLVSIYNHLEVGYDKQIMIKAKSMVHKRPKVTKHDIKWRQTERFELKRFIDETDFLNGYKFEKDEDKILAEKAKEMEKKQKKYDEKMKKKKEKK